MGRYDEPTQRVRTSQPPAAPLPGSLDPLRGHQTEPETVETGTGWVDTSGTTAEDLDTAVASPEPTGVLPLDEIFDTPGPGPGSGPARPVRESTAATEAPTWTAMPVVPVRSEPLPAGPPDRSWNQPYDETAESGSNRGSAIEGVEEAWAGTRERFEAWLRRDDNGLMLLTALVACILMIVVAGVGG